VQVNGATLVPLASLRLSQAQVYNAVKAALRAQTVVLPPSAAVAGAFATTDRERGVWKAPSNRRLHDVLEPMVAVTATQQESLAMDAIAGRSINTVRSLPGHGILVWGSRTLAGHDNEWRYVPVRRFFNSVETAVKTGTAWVASEPNNTKTWTTLKASLEAYLLNLWQHGALQGSKQQQAFFVKCGLGQTMTAADVAAGRLHLEIGLAVLRPAEFISLKVTLATMRA
jgi:uncharacterized protein